MNTSTIQQERRQNGRKTLNPLPYINLPSDNGGIVLDVSEGGLRFRAIAPLVQSGPIPFWFTAHSDLIAGEAELVWLDEAKKTGGLRFTQLPYNAVEQIRSWPSDPNLRPSIGDDLTLDISSPEPPSRKKKWGDYTAFAFHAIAQLNRRGREWTGSVRGRLVPIVENGLGELRTLLLPANVTRNKTSLSMAACALLLCIVIPALSYTHRRQVGASLIWMGTRMSGETRTVTPAPAIADPAPSVIVLPDSKSTAQNNALPTPTPDPGLTTVAKAAPSGLVGTEVPETNVRLQQPNSSDKKLFVQVAALTQETEARDLASKLQQENFHAFVRTLPADSLNRVVLGPYTDQASARVALGKLKKAGFDSFIRRESVAEWLGS